MSQLHSWAQCPASPMPGLGFLGSTSRRRRWRGSLATPNRTEGWRPGCNDPSTPWQNLEAGTRQRTHSGLGRPHRRRGPTASQLWQARSASRTSSRRGNRCPNCTSAGTQTDRCPARCTRPPDDRDTSWDRKPTRCLRARSLRCSTGLGRAADTKRPARTRRTGSPPNTPSCTGLLQVRHHSSLPSGKSARHHTPASTAQARPSLGMPPTPPKPPVGTPPTPPSPYPPKPPGGTPPTPPSPYPPKPPVGTPPEPPVVTPPVPPFAELVDWTLPPQAADEGQAQHHPPALHASDLAPDVRSVSSAAGHGVSAWPGPVTASLLP